MALPYHYLLIKHKVGLRICKNAKACVSEQKPSDANWGGWILTFGRNFGSNFSLFLVQHAYVWSPGCAAQDVREPCI